MTGGAAQMQGPGEADKAQARQGRIVALVIAASGLLAILAPFIVAVSGLPARYEMLFYFVALGGFVWALVVAIRMLRAARTGDKR
ncbi:DUF5337 domain-containing protein [Tropicimonas sp. IMCC34043]|uniref:DUF5337 domain-containing protein n=1 Tax=Tropicimonas sp. IMCC34043 TaxID=2248760 RepID=UPI001E3E94A7|nr:DUF5337 domain-containing protein [Tropicimonas sp. IMCC34043]